MTYMYVEVHLVDTWLQTALPTTSSLVTLLCDPIPACYTTFVLFFPSFLEMKTA